MRICPLALRGAAAAVALTAALPLTVAQAHDHSSVRATVTPSSAAPGATVEVSVSGCDGTTGSAGSGAFDGEVKLTGRDGDQFSLNGSGRIKHGVAGTYDVSVTCDGHPHQGAGTVHVIQHNPAPVSPVRAGGGGTAELAVAAPQGADEAGPGTRHAVIGLVLAGVAAVAVAFRSVRRRRSG
ncbi:hypothetical protein [Streptomyces kanamyceticus]|uniref:Uncharacterized protein n=1 Tax=Streptomyces kanamyceticus TaxID=1967 RepID=A0A5J6GE07_STRKN|nr:hypothetical protein [Streptomyces kanamyceticus]QEU94160.1 hypothetical protein CP970_27555 [Streptomyces kanamyceticus]